MPDLTFKTLTEEQKAAEDKIVDSPENRKIRQASITAYIAGDHEECDRLAKKLIVPANLLKALGKDFVNSKGLPTITCEMIDDTEWLK